MAGGYPPGAANDSSAPYNARYSRNVIGYDDDGEPIYYEPEYEPEDDYDRDFDEPD